MNTLEVVQYAPYTGPFDIERDHHVGVVDAGQHNAVWVRLTEGGGDTTLSGDWWATSSKDTVSISEHGQPIPPTVTSQPFGVKLLLTHQFRVTVPLLGKESRHKAGAVAFVGQGLRLISEADELQLRGASLKHRREAFRTGKQALRAAVMASVADIN